MMKNNKLYFYIEDINGGFIVDEDYINNDFDNVNQKLLCVGSLEDIENHIKWLCNDKEIQYK